MADLANGRAEGKSSPEKLDRLLKFLYEMDESKPEEVKEALASQGIDTEELVKEGMQLIRSFEKTERVKLAQAKRKRLAEIFDKLRSIDPSQSIDAVRKR